MLRDRASIMAIGVFGRAQRVAGRRVHDHDAQPGGRPRVDVVGADAGPHDGLEAMVSFQGVGGDFDAAAANGAVELGQGRAKCVPLQSGTNLVLDAGGLGQQIEPFLGERVENDDFGHGSECALWMKRPTLKLKVWQIVRRADRGQAKFTAEQRTSQFPGLALYPGGRP